MSLYGDKSTRHYEQLLAQSRVEGKVGINIHMNRPTTAESRLGFRGKKATKNDLKLIAEKLANAAKRNPTLLKAAVNVASKVQSFKAQDKLKQKKNEERKQVEEARKILKVLEAQAQAKQQSSAQVKQSTTASNDYELRQKLLEEQKTKLASDLKVVQYGKNVYLNVKNSAG